jgi:hypothetical protein
MQSRYSQSACDVGMSAQPESVRVRVRVRVMVRVRVRVRVRVILVKTAQLTKASSIELRKKTPA